MREKSWPLSDDERAAVATVEVALTSMALLLRQTELGASVRPANVNTANDRRSPQRD